MEQEALYWTVAGRPVVKGIRCVPRAATTLFAVQLPRHAFRQTESLQGWTNYGVYKLECPKSNPEEVY